MSDRDIDLSVDPVDLGLGTPESTDDFLYEAGITLTDEQKNLLLDYLIAERDALSSIREGRERKWELYRQHREGRSAKEVQNFPWDGASNVVPPVASSNTNGVYSHVRRAFLKRVPLWSASTEFPELYDQMESWTRFLNGIAMAPSKANFGACLRSSLYEAISLGDQIVEVVWQERRIRFKRISDGSNQLIDKITYAGPVALPHRIENVYVRESIDNLQEQPVIAIRYEGWTIGRLRELERDGFFENVDSVVDAIKSEFDTNKESLMKREGFESDMTDNTIMIDVWKSYVYWDVDGDGFSEDVVVWYSEEGKQILRVEANEFGVRTITNMRYYPVPYLFYSRGVGSMAEHVQEEITSLHNMRINSLALNSLQMFVSRHGSDFGRKESLYPLKNLKTDDPQRDIKVLTFPDVSQGTLEAEMNSKRYLDLHTGVSEAMLGMPDQTAKSGTSPSLQMFLAQQGSAILESAVESLAEAISEIGLYFTLHLVKNSDSLLDRLDMLVSPEDYDNVKSILEMNIEDIPEKMRMEVKTTEVQKSEDAKRQNLMALNQLYSMYANEVMQYMQVLVSPEVPEEMKQFALRIYVGKTKVMEETLQLMGQSDTGDYVPYIRDVEMMLSMLDEQKRSLLQSLKSQSQSQSQSQRF